MPRDYPVVGQIIAIKHENRWTCGFINLIHRSMYADTIYDIAHNCYDERTARHCGHIWHIRQTQIQEWKEFLNDYDLGI